jgi:MFS family permease
MAMSLLGGAIADRFDRRRLLLLDQGALVLTASALAACMFAGWTPVAALYVLAVSVYGAGAAGTGLLYASVAAGGTVTALASGWLGHARRLGRILLVAVAVWGVAVALAASPGRCCWRRPSSRWRAAPTA